MFNLFKTFITRCREALKASPLLNEVSTIHQEEFTWCVCCAMWYSFYYFFPTVQLEAPLFGNAGFWAVEYLIGTLILRVFYMFNQKIPLDWLIRFWGLGYFAGRFFTLLPYFWLLF